MSETRTTWQTGQPLYTLPKGMLQPLNSGHLTNQDMHLSLSQCHVSTTNHLFPPLWFHFTIFTYICTSCAYTVCTCISRGVGSWSTKLCLGVVGVNFRGVTVLRGTEKLTSNLPSSVRESRVNSEGDRWCKMTPVELETKLRCPTASLASTQSSRHMSLRSGRVYTET